MRQPKVTELHEYDLPYGSTVAANFMKPDVLDGSQMIGLVNTDHVDGATGVMISAEREDSDSMWFLDLPVDVARQLHQRLGELFG